MIIFAAIKIRSLFHRCVIVMNLVLSVSPFVTVLFKFISRVQQVDDSINLNCSLHDLRINSYNVVVKEKLMFLVSKNRIVQDVSRQ